MRRPEVLGSIYFAQAMQSDESMMLQNACETLEAQMSSKLASLCWEALPVMAFILWKRVD